MRAAGDDRLFERQAGSWSRLHANRLDTPRLIAAHIVEESFDHACRVGRGQFEREPPRAPLDQVVAYDAQKYEPMDRSLALLASAISFLRLLRFTHRHLDGLPFAEFPDGADVREHAPKGVELCPDASEGVEEEPQLASDVVGIVPTDLLVLLTCAHRNRCPR